MALTEKQLLKKKTELEDSKNKVAELQGEKKGLMKRLATEFGCEDIAAARLSVRAMKKSIEELDAQIEEKTNAIEEKYFNDEE